eukprot:g1498.t1
MATFKLNIPQDFQEDFSSKRQGEFRPRTSSAHDQTSSSSVPAKPQIRPQSAAPRRRIQKPPVQRYQDAFRKGIFDWDPSDVNVEKINIGTGTKSATSLININQPGGVISPKGWKKSNAKKVKQRPASATLRRHRRDIRSRRGIGTFKKRPTTSQSHLGSQGSGFVDNFWGTIARVRAKTREEKLSATARAIESIDMSSIGKEVSTKVDKQTEVVASEISTKLHCKTRKDKESKKAKADERYDEVENLFPPSLFKKKLKVKMNMKTLDKKLSRRSKQMRKQERNETLLSNNKNSIYSGIGAVYADDDGILHTKGGNEHINGREQRRRDRARMNGKRRPRKKNVSKYAKSVNQMRDAESIAQAYVENLPEVDDRRDDVDVVALMAKDTRVHSAHRRFGMGMGMHLSSSRKVPQPSQNLTRQFLEPEEEEVEDYKFDSFDIQGQLDALTRQKILREPEQWIHGRETVKTIQSSKFVRPQTSSDSKRFRSDVLSIETFYVERLRDLTIRSRQEWEGRKEDEKRFVAAEPIIDERIALHNDIIERIINCSTPFEKLLRKARNGLKESWELKLNCKLEKIQFELDEIKVKLENEQKRSNKNQEEEEERQNSEKNQNHLAEVKSLQEKLSFMTRKRDSLREEIAVLNGTLHAQETSMQAYEEELTKLKREEGVVVKPYIDEIDCLRAENRTLMEEVQNYKESYERKKNEIEGLQEKIAQNILDRVELNEEGQGREEEEVKQVDQEQEEEKVKLKQVDQEQEEEEVINLNQVDQEQKEEEVNLNQVDQEQEEEKVNLNQVDLKEEEKGKDQVNERKEVVSIQVDQEIEVQNEIEKDFNQDENIDQDEIMRLKKETQTWIERYKQLEAALEEKERKNKVIITQLTKRHKVEMKKLEETYQYENLENLKKLEKLENLKNLEREEEIKKKVVTSEELQMLENVENVQTLGCEEKLVMKEEVDKKLLRAGKQVEELQNEELVEQRPLPPTSGKVVKVGYEFENLRQR